MKIKKALSLVLLFAATNAFAATFKLPDANASLIGKIQYISVAVGDTAALIGQRYDLGFNAIENANPQYNLERAFPFGATLQIPTKHLLPNFPRQGIVVNIPEMRMYYYPAGTNQVITYPIGIGKIGKTLPIANTTIIKKVENPPWSPPEDIREFNLQQGIILPKIMPAGPDNPLGPLAIYMDLPTFLMHSTIFPESIGKRASFGCVRMYESDMKTLFPKVEPGIPVVIVNSPVKFGWQYDRLFMEAYKPLEENGNDFDATLAGMVHLANEAAKDQNTLIDWQAISFISKERDGIPHEVGIRIRRS